MRFFVFIAAIFLGSTANAQTVSASDPVSVANVLIATGYKAEFDTDKLGDPVLKSITEGVNFNIYFFGCTDNKDCQNLMFSAGFDKSSEMTAAQMNDWNSSTLVGKAYIDEEGDPFLRVFITGVQNIPAVFV